MSKENDVKKDLMTNEKTICSVTSISEEVTVKQGEEALLSCTVDANPIGLADHQRQHQHHHQHQHQHHNHRRRRRRQFLLV